MTTTASSAGAAGNAPGRVWLRIAGGGISLPSGKPYITMVGDDREQERHVAYVRSDLVEHLREALEFIRDGYANQDVDHITFRVKSYEAALDALSASRPGGVDSSQPKKQSET